MKNERTMRDYLLQVEAELRELASGQHYMEEEYLVYAIEDVAGGIRYFLEQRGLTEAEHD